MLKPLPDNVFDDSFVPGYNQVAIDIGELQKYYDKKKEFNELEEKINELFVYVNTLSDTKRLCYAIVRVLSKKHRTLQQSFVKEILVALYLYSEYIFKNDWFDARNEDVANLHKELKDTPERFRFI